MTKILIIEDELKLCQLIREYLTRYGFEIYEIHDFKNVEGEIVSLKPDLILLDINLPYMDGFYLCRYIRTKMTIPVIIVSARNSEMEQIMGMELGADDYVVKPFHLDVLHSKIKAALRRAYGEYAGNHQTKQTINGLSLNANNFKMAYQGREMELSKNEFKLLKKLLDRANSVISREDLLMEIWDDTNFVEDNTLTVNITRLKSKLEELNIHQVIKTIRGVGYILDWTVEEGE